MVRTGMLAVGLGLCAASAQAQTGSGTGLPSGFTASGLPFGPTSTVATVAAPTPTMAIANPGGLSFGGASGSGGSFSGIGRNAGGLSFGGASGLGGSASGVGSAAGGLRFGGSASTVARGAGPASTGGGIGSAPRRPLDDATGGVGSGRGGSPAGAGISGAGASRRPTDAYFDPLAGSGFR